MNIIITGASDGLGFEIAKKFVEEGHNVAICARTRSKLQNAVYKLMSIRKVDQQIVFDSLDVSCEGEIKSFITKTINLFKKVDVLINNAGGYGPKGKIEDTNSMSWESCLKTNLMGPYYTMKYIIPHMKENNYGKIINLSGGGATNPLPFISAYAASKAGLVRLTETIAKEVFNYNIYVNAIAPGALETKMYDEILEAGPEVVGKEFYEKITKQKKTPLNLGAELCYFLSSKESDGITGRLISAVWDNWKSKDFKDEVTKDDKYTLRRKV